MGLVKSAWSLLGVFSVLVAMVGWRLWWWKDQVEGLSQGQKFELEVRLSRPVEVNQFGCEMEWRGWYLILSQAICESSNLTTLSAGDILNLEIDNHSRISKVNRRLQVVAVVEIDRVNNAMTSIYWWQRQTWQFREKSIKIVQKVLPAREAGLVVGILLGVKSELANNFSEALIRTGTMHVVAASGYNIAVVMSMVSELLMRLMSRQKAAIISLLLIWVYVFAAGSDPPIVRAGLMGSLTLFSWFMGREVWVLFGYLVGGFIMIAGSPWLWESVSFQLSMAATAGVIWGSRWLYLVFGRMTNWMKRFVVADIWWNNFVTSLAATAAVLPLLLMHFGEVSLLGLVVNPLVLWFVPLIMSLGAAIVISGFVWFPLAQFVGWLGLSVIKGWIYIVMIAARMPGGMITCATNWLTTWGWWILWTGVILLTWRRKTIL